MQKGFSLVSLFVVMVILSPLHGRDGSSMYINKFAVEFHGDIGELERFARDHGYVVHGQVCIVIVAAVLIVYFTVKQWFGNFQIR